LPATGKNIPQETKTARGFFENFGKSFSSRLFSRLFLIQFLYFISYFSQTFIIIKKAGEKFLSRPLV